MFYTLKEDNYLDFFSIEICDEKMTQLTICIVFITILIVTDANTILYRYSKISYNYMHCNCYNTILTRIQTVTSKLFYACGVIM